MSPSDKSIRRDAPTGRKTAKNPKRNQEIEVKLRVTDRPALLARLAELGAICEGRVHEMNILYDTPQRKLMRGGRLLRIRVERPADQGDMPVKVSTERRTTEGAVLTFKGPVRQPVSPSSSTGRKYKVREEREVRVADGEQLAAILEALGLRPSFRYEKYRSTYRLPGVGDVVLELDETPIGDFVEAEGTRMAIDRSAALLGYRAADYVTKSYGALFLDATRKSGRSKPSKRSRFAGLGVRDMLFATTK